MDTLDDKLSKLVTDEVLDQYILSKHDEIKELLHHPTLILMFLSLLHPLFYYGT